MNYEDIWICQRLTMDFIWSLKENLLSLKTWSFLLGCLWQPNRKMGRVSPSFPVLENAKIAQSYPSAFTTMHLGSIPWQPYYSTNRESS